VPASKTKAGGRKHPELAGDNYPFGKCETMRRSSCALLLGLALAGCSNTPQSSPNQVTEQAIPKSRVETGIKLARIQEKQGHLHKALEMYENMHRSDPNNAELCQRLAVVYTRLDQPAKADEFFQKSTRLQPDNAELHADYVYACYLRGELTQAEQLLKKAHALRPGDERITGYLALVVASQGRAEESMTYYRQYLDEADAHANLGFVLTQQGDLAGARDRYTKALSLNPSLKSAQHALLQLAELDQTPKSKPAPKPAATPKPQIQPQQNARTDWQPTGTASIRS
jgi:Flp pilus assembly protein TadD